MNGGLVGLLGDWQAGPLSTPPGRHQRAAVLLLSELCSGPLCHTYICTWPSTHKCKWGWTRIKVHAQIHVYTYTWTQALFLFLSVTHTHIHALTHSLSLFFAPSCQKPVKLRVCCSFSFLHRGRKAGYCLDRTVYMCFPPSCSTVSPHGEMSHEALRISRHACPSWFRLSQW